LFLEKQREIKSHREAKECCAYCRRTQLSLEVIHGDVSTIFAFEMKVVFGSFFTVNQRRRPLGLSIFWCTDFQTENGTHTIICTTLSPHSHVNQFKSKFQNAQNSFILLVWRHFRIKKINIAPRDGECCEIMWGVVANILVYKFSNRKWNTHHNLHNIITSHSCK